MTAKTLIIAEKPSVAGDLVKVLPGKFKKEKTHYESDTYIVSYAIGHLVSICYPEEIDPAYQKWDMSTLPILPKTFPLKALDGTKSQLNVLQKLIRRNDVAEVINACDAGREGELIFKYIVNYVWNSSVAKKKFRRLWLQSMTADAIRRGFDNLRDNKEMTPLEDTALCRSESDWLIGINATRALTGYNSRKGGFFLTPCGRVQTPTLSLIVKREQVRREFIPTPYSVLLATFAAKDQSYLGKWIDPAFSKEEKDGHGRADRIWDPARAEAILQKCTGRPARVEESSKETSQRSPQLFDLTSLQREANSRFGFSAKNTLALAQALYERHKVLTYPRTDSRFLPEDYIKTSYAILDSQCGWNYGRFAREAIDKKYVHPDKRIFNNGKVSDHHAIIPTTLLPRELSEPEMKIYQMVVQRFLAVFFPAAIYLNTRRLSIVEEETFLTEGKILLAAGWKAIYGAGGEKTEEQLLTALDPDARVLCEKIDREDKETTPPPRFTEATLLSAMENSDKFIDDEELADAMKERGLGTPATRAAIIEKLINEKYLVREGKELAPTGKAIELLSLLEAMKIEALASPEMTGEWEFKLNQILKGQFTRAQFMKEIRDLTRHITDQIKNFKQDDVRQEAAFSPVDGVRFYGTPSAWVSENGDLTIRKILGGRVMADEEIVALIRGETIGPFSDFRSKRGKPFTASVRLAGKKIDFLFADATDELDIDAIKQGPSLGTSPLDGSPVFETPAGYMSASALDGDEKKGLKIGKIILSKEIAPHHVRQLLTDGKTELIKGFISKRRRPFDAYLLLAANGKISFEFPPRKQKRAQQSN